MNAAVIDTNVLIDCFQRGGGAADAISDYDRILVCPAVIGEFKAGIDTGTKRGRKRKSALTSSWTILRSKSFPVPMKRRSTTRGYTGL